jgi:hypothetical protein
MTFDPNFMNKYLIDLAESPDTQFWTVDYAELSPVEQVFLAVWELEAEVNNGGFEQYFSNSSGLLAGHAENALQAIKAFAMAEIVHRAIEVVGADIAWNDDTARKTRVATLSAEQGERLNDLDQEFYRYPDNLTALLFAYVQEFGHAVKGYVSP